MLAHGIKLLATGLFLVAGCAPKVYGPGDPRVSSPAAPPMFDVVAPDHLGFQRTVVVEVQVSETGEAESVRAVANPALKTAGKLHVDPGGHPALKTSALSAARSAKYEPAVVEGSPAKQKILVPVVFNPGDPLVSPPLIKHYQPPEYPESMREAGARGEVVVEVLVGMGGSVIDARVIKSAGRLDTFALEAARQSLFHPARADGKAVDLWVVMNYKFALL